MRKINRLDIYLETAIDEGIKIISTWGNRKAYEDVSPYKHLVQNINGWVGEEIFKATFPEWDYMDKEEHTYLSESIDPSLRQGLPDFINTVTGKTCELKTYWNNSTINGKINKWKNNSKELHNADVVVILNRNEDKSPIEFYILNRTDWTTTTINVKAVYPSWYKGFVEY